MARQVIPWAPPYSAQDYVDWTQTDLVGKLNANTAELYAGNDQPSDYGMLGWTYPVKLATTWGGIAGGANAIVNRIMIPAACTVTSILIYVVVAGTTLTAGGNFAGLYDGTGDRLGVTADQTTAWGTTGLKTMNLTSPTAIPAGWIYAAWVSNFGGGGATPQFLRQSGLQTLLNYGKTFATGLTAGLLGSKADLPDPLGGTPGVTTYVTWFGLV